MLVMLISLGNIKLVLICYLMLTAAIKLCTQAIAFILSYISVASHYPFTMHSHMYEKKAALNKNPVVPHANDNAFKFCVHNP